MSGETDDTADLDADVVILTMTDKTLAHMADALRAYADAGFAFAWVMGDRIIVSKLPMDEALLSPAELQKRVRAERKQVLAERRRRQQQEAMGRG